MVEKLLTALGNSKRFEKCRKIKVKNSTLMLDIAHTPSNGENRPPHRRMMLMILLTLVSIACIFFVVYCAAFFINEVLLFDKPPVVTESGAIVPQRSCHREQVLFFFSSSDRWASTGVQLSKGDRIKISTSGGFHSDIANLTESARMNRRPTYAYYTNKPLSEMSEEERAMVFDGTKNCIYSLDTEDENLKARFGSVLWTVSDENSISKSDFDDKFSDRIHQVEPVKNAERFIEIEQSGELFFSVNDIYLSDRVIRSMSEDGAEIIPEDGSWQSKELLAELHDNGMLFICPSIENEDRLKCISDANHLIEIFNDNGDNELLNTQRGNLREMWFNDNVGNIMICVEIERNISLMHGMSKWYRTIERIVDSLYMGWFSSKFGIICLTLLLCIGVIIFSGLFVLLVYLIFHPSSLKALSNPKEIFRTLLKEISKRRYSFIYISLILLTILSLLITDANFDICVTLLLIAVILGYMLLFPLRHIFIRE